ncbi:MAG: O-antigen ligase family protein [Ignavibacteriales bacterium]|nr:O-antigen ligase family protein [Ignavibacteriales bacterium]
MAINLRLIVNFIQTKSISLLLFIGIFAIGVSIPIKYSVALFLMVPILLLLSFNFNWTVFLIILASNLAIYIYGTMTFSSLAAWVCIYSFFLTHKFDFVELRHPLSKPILAFFLSVLPSFFNTIVLFHATILLLQLIAFVLICHVLRAHINSEDDIKKILDAFVFFVTLNIGVILLLGSFTNHRLFGIGSVSFVDYAVMGLIIFYHNVLYHKNGRTLNIFLMMLTTIAIIYTQTRSTLILASIILLIISIQYLKDFDKPGLAKSVLIIKFVFGTIFIGIAIGFLYVLQPAIFGRFSSEQISGSALEAGGGAYSSLTTRFMIWDTAYNAFVKHPFLGIGWNSFPYSSHLYSKLPYWMFDHYVKHLSTHQTFVTILTEAGVFSFVIFIWLIFSQIKTALRVRRRKNVSPYYRNILSWLAIYIVFSMCFTDAWLYGDEIIVWGLFLGLLLGYEKISLLNTNKTISVSNSSVLI